MCTLRPIIILLAILASGASVVGAQGLSPEEIQIAVEERAEEIKAEKTAKARIEEYRKKDTPEMRKARKEIERTQKDLKSQAKKMARAYDRADIYGCDEDSVYINPRATGFYSINPHVKLRVKNPYPFSINIHDESGLVVGDLCPGGSMTLFRARNVWRDGQFLDFQWTAEAALANGSQAVDSSRRFTVTAWDAQYGRLQQYDTWVVQLREVQAR